MAPHLADLQAELQLSIVSYLLPNDIGLRDDDYQEKYNDQGNNAPSRYSKMKDREIASRRNLINWSCASQFFRRLLAPHIFKSVILRNDEKSAGSINSIAKHQVYNKCVEQFQFEGDAPGDARREDPAFSDIANILPDSVAVLLSDLKRFPNLKLLSVEFAYDFENYNQWNEEGANPAGVLESDEEARAAEGKEAWRALMVKVWEAILRNRAGVVKDLGESLTSNRISKVIKRLYYKIVSIFSSPSFHNFLNNLSSFNLSIYGGDNGAGWKTNTGEEWSDFVAKLDSYFFSHLHNVASFTLRATEEAPLGLEGMNHAPLNLRQEHMPLLRTTYLEFIFIGPELRDFLAGHVTTLKSIHLRNCLAEGDNSLAENNLPWHALLTAISKANPTKLRTFKISSDRPAELPDTVGDCGDFGSKLEDEDDSKLELEIEDAKKRVREEGRRVFAHVVVDDKYGMLFEDEEENFCSFREGKDEEALEELMRIVRRNAGDFCADVERRDEGTLGPRPEGSQAA